MVLVPPLLLGASCEFWFYNGLVLLVIACPCALVISTPVSIVASLAAAARKGVLVKGGVYLEAPAHLRAMALDKTGTLTQGQPNVVAVIPLNGHDESELIERALALELRSEHPLARAIVEHAAQLGIKAIPADDFQMIQGKGSIGQIGGRRFWLGSHRYLQERGQETQQIRDLLNAMSGTGRSVVVVGNEEHVCGFIALADSVRSDAKNALAGLREAGVDHLIMLTGDNHSTAQAIAKQLGMEFRAELLP